MYFALSAKQCCSNTGRQAVAGGAIIPSGARSLLLSTRKNSCTTLFAQSCDIVHRFKAPYKIGENEVNSSLFIGQFPRHPDPKPLPVLAVDDVRNKTEQYRDGPLGRCATAFVANIERIAAIGNVTVHVVGLSGFLRSLDQYMTNRLHNLRRNNKAPIEWESPLGEQIKRSFREIWELFHYPLPEKMRRKQESSGHGELRHWAHLHRDIQLGVATILSAQVALAWTAFEMLATDLWISALNEAPNPLAVRFASSMAEKQQGKSVAISQLAEYGRRDFNLSSVMGTLLKDIGKADFTSLRSTKFAYEKAFGEKIALFDHNGLQVLELVRNLVLHNAGIIDAKFLDSLKERGISRQGGIWCSKNMSYFP